MRTFSDADIVDPGRFERLEHHDVFRELRAEDPVHWTETGNGPGFWSITKLNDLVAVNRDAVGFSSEAQGVNLNELDDEELVFDVRGQMMLMTDPPKHTRYRLLVNKGFTPRMINLLEDHLRLRAELIVDRVVETGGCDFVTDLAAELPLQAIAEIMGVPQEERHLLFDWTNRLVGSDDPEYRPDGPDDEDVAGAAAAELYMYSTELRARREADPRDDIVTKLINAEIDGDRLTEAEFHMFIMLLAVAGNETTRNATSHGVHALLTHPEQLALLRSDRSLLPGAVEEVVRWGTPVHHFRRQSTIDVVIRDRQIRAGDKVVMWHCSANRDEDAFDDPFRFDITRSPNEHVGFGGGGPHFCLGANLARMELRLIFDEILERLTDLQLVGEPERLRSNFISGIKHMNVTFTPGKRRHAESAAA
jgi:cholest-4-en-3-one 26-monooxygenase